MPLLLFIIINVETAKVHKHLIKRLSEIIKKRKRSDRLLSWLLKSLLCYTGRWLLAYSQNIRTDNFIYSFRNQYWSTLNLLISTLNLIIARLWSVICRLPFWLVPRKSVGIAYLSYFGIIMDLGISNVAYSRTFLFLHSLAVLVTRLAWLNMYNNIEAAAFS